jgi:hypothetical protein
MPLKYKKWNDERIIKLVFAFIIVVVLMLTYSLSVCFTVMILTTY